MSTIDLTKLDVDILMQALKIAKEKLQLRQDNILKRMVHDEERNDPTISK